MTKYSINLTQRQKEVLNLIRKELDNTGFPPTRAEIAEKLGFNSPNAAEQHLRALEKKGIISLKSGTSRGIRIIDSQNFSILEEQVRFTEISQIIVPLIGSVAAGSPLSAIEHIQKEFQIDRSLFNEKPDFLLKVKGMSMKDAGIIDGDLLAVKKQNEVIDGELVVARINEEVTVKRFRKKEGIIYLIAENPDFSNIVVNNARENFSIEGKVIGLIRNTVF